MNDNEARSLMILDINATNSPTIKKMIMSHLISLQKTINKQDEEIRALMKYNAK